MDERVSLELELPQGEQRERLLDALGNLVRRRGCEAFVSAPILLPQSEYFPEPWERSVSGARRLLRRLMHYAGLGELKVRLNGWRERPVFTSTLAPRHTDGHTAAWFGGHRDGVREFGVELDQLRHEGSLVAALGHEVAHAYRDYHDLVIRDRDLEEKLTDLTCVYLGFGVFSLNASHAVETGGFSASGEKLLYETRSLGYLSPGELALLLSAQLAVRDDRALQRAVLGELLPNHAELVSRGLREFGSDVEALRQRLFVPTPAAWPRPRPELVPLPDEDDDDDEDLSQSASHPDEQQAQRGNQVVFRVKRDRATGIGLLALGGSALGSMAFDVASLAFYGVCALGTAAGFAAGRRLRADECSGCRARLNEGDERCADCGAQVVGEIATHADRLEAEEQYRAERGETEPDEVGAEHDEEEPVAVLLTAMLAAWGLSRGLLAEDGSAEGQRLASRVRERDFDTEALYAAWVQGQLLTDEAMSFAHYYCGEATQLRDRDFQIITTANQLDERPANYQRFAAILDRRFAEWKQREEALG